MKAKIIISQTPTKYEEAYLKMLQYQQDLISGSGENIIWFLEHEDILTAGTSASASDLRNQEALPIYNTNRGGKYTYHGLGQRVIYFILNLKELYQDQPPDIRDFVRRLEQWQIEAIAQIGISVHNDLQNIGIWYNESSLRQYKLVAMGLRLSKWVTSHGIAININPDLSKFDNIIPCGIADPTKKVGSIAKILNQALPTSYLDDILIKSLIDHFGFNIELIKEK